MYNTLPYTMRRTVTFLAATMLALTAVAAATAAEKKDDSDLANALFGAAQRNDKLTVTVTNPAGRPVADALVLVRPAQTLDVTTATTNDKGVAEVSNPMIGMKMDRKIAVVAPGFATTLNTVGRDEATAKIKLKKGRKITVKLEGPGAANVPADARLAVVSGDAAGMVTWIVRDPSLHSRAIKNVGPGTFEATVPAKEKTALVVADDPRWIRFFQSEEITLPANVGKKPLTVNVPAPGKVTLSYAPAERNAADPPYKGIQMHIGKSIKFPKDSRNNLFITDNFSRETTSDSVTIENAAEGSYYASGQASELKDRNLMKDPRAYQSLMGSDSSRFEIKSSQHADVAMFYDPPRKEDFVGDKTARIRVKAANGKPAANLSYTISASSRKSRGAEVEVTSGTLDAQGEAVVTNLTAGFSGTIAPTAKDAKNNIVSYEVTFGNGGESASMTLFERQGDTLVETTETEKLVEINIPPGIGDTAPDITLTKVSDGSTMKLSDLRGKAVYIDFWATWCGPCQEPMAELNALEVKKRKDWGNKVVLLGASIDEDRETVAKHIKKNDWEKIPQYWCADNPGFQSVQAAAYGIRGVPTALLIDKEGKIVWRGHPSGFNKSQLDEYAK